MEEKFLEMENDGDDEVKKDLSKILIQWGLGLLLILLLFFFGDVSRLARLPDIRWDAVFLVFLSNVGFTLAHNFRWKGIVDNLSGQKGTHFFSLYRSLVDSYAVGKIIPMDVSLFGLRSYYLKRFQNISMSTAIFSVLLDRFLDLLLLLIMALPSFLVISQIASTTQSVLVFLLLLIVQGFVIFWKKEKTFYFFLWLYRTFLVHWLLKIPFLGARISEETKAEVEIHHFHFASVLRIMTWNYIKYLFLCLRFFFTGLAMGIHFPLVSSFFFIPFVQLSGLINITPGGLGVVEMGTYGALLLMGIPKSQVLVFVFGQRILLFSIFLSLFILSHLFYFIQSRWRRFGAVGWK
jgi:uncharacterized protein (TIRG00374 family)